MGEKKEDIFDFSGQNLFTQGFEYMQDAWQRSVLYWDVMRKRGNVYLEHLANGQPPVLTFDYETIEKGTELPRPVNHDLVRILPTEKNMEKADSVHKADPGKVEEYEEGPDPYKRPIVVVDPRAGHGPGIGGSKIDSQVGVALKDGHPVYFILFHPDPMPGQTLGDVEKAQIYFVETVKNRHPKAEEPALIGNCQAGWAIALMSADRPDITGPLVLNGSPLSYWSGVEGENRMRYRGGVFGGIWLASLFCDLGNGKFDGAHLVSNFESLNPANTLWTKQYNLYAKIDTEEERYLNFEKWWNGYFYMTAEEIRFIISNLFIGNRPEQGGIELNKGETIDLKNLEDPIVLFASKGDNITPPQQALNWVARVYGTVEEIKNQGQVIIYTIHEKVGHLGIFVSGSVAKKEHRGIIGTIDMIDYLSPGLYEMVIEEGDPANPVSQQNVRFERRDISDILAMDDGFEDEVDFRYAAAVSEMNDKLYESFLAPWIRMMTTEYSAEWIRQMHPLRFTRYGFSDHNPMLKPVKNLAPLVKEFRSPVSKDNLFVQMEKAMSESFIALLDGYRDQRDTVYEHMFKWMYGNPFLRSFIDSVYCPDEKDMEACAMEAKPDAEELKKKEKQAQRRKWMSRMKKGGFAEGVVRVMLLMADADQIFDQRELFTAEEMIRGDAVLRKLSPTDFRELVKEQSAILETDPEKAINSLPELLKTEEERRDAYQMAEKIADADSIVIEQEEEILQKIRNSLML